MMILQAFNSSVSQIHMAGCERYHCSDLSKQAYAMSGSAHSEILQVRHRHCGSLCQWIRIKPDYRVKAGHVPFVEKQVMTMFMLCHWLRR